MACLITFNRRPKANHLFMGKFNLDSFTDWINTPPESWLLQKQTQRIATLATQFEQHTITRTYEALTFGCTEKDSGEIHLPIGRDTHDSKKHSPSTERPLESITEYQVTHRYGTIASHIVLHPHTGRTHQLRVHLTSLGVPILGDVMYGGQKVTCVAGIPIPRVMLHARTLGFQHPTSRSFQEYTVDFPLDMQTVRQKLQHVTELTNSQPSHLHVSHSSQRQTKRC